MRVAGVVLEFADIDPRMGETENRWQDLVILPQRLALRGVLWARRYHASADLMAQRFSALPEVPQDKAMYSTLHWYSDGDPHAVLQRMSELERADRTQRRGAALTTHLRAAYRLTETFLSKEVPTANEAIPFLGHRAVHVTLGEVPNKADIEEAGAWWRNTHFPDYMEVSGWLAAMRFEPAAPGYEGKYLNIFWLGADPIRALAEVDAAIPRWRALGHTPVPRGIYRRTFTGAFRPITPLAYDFLASA